MKEQWEFFLLHSFESTLILHPMFIFNVHVRLRFHFLLFVVCWLQDKSIVHFSKMIFLIIDICCRYCSRVLSKTYHELLILCQIFPYLSSLHVTVFSLLHKGRQIIFNHNILIKFMLRPQHQMEIPSSDWEIEIF